MKNYSVQVAATHHLHHAETISKLIATSALQRGTGIAKRSPEYIRQKIKENMGVIATTTDGKLVGFCYIESWENKKFVVNSGLIISHEFRNMGAAKKIKKKAFEHSKKCFPGALLFGLTTSLPVMKINSRLGYIPVTYERLTSDELFWKGCQSCINYEILTRKNQKNCLCTAMVYDSSKKNRKVWNMIEKSKIYERFMQIKKVRLTRKKFKK